MIKDLEMKRSSCIVKGSLNAITHVLVRERQWEIDRVPEEDMVWLWRRRQEGCGHKARSSKESQRP